MIIQNLMRNKSAALLIGLTVLIAAIHTWQPITISPTSSGERFNLTFMMIAFACLIPFGYRFARISLGILFLLFSTVNLLIALAYVRSIDGNSIQIVFTTVILGFVAYSLLLWKGIRVFENERTEQPLVNS